MSIEHYCPCPSDDVDARDMALVWCVASTRRLSLSYYIFHRLSKLEHTSIEREREARDTRKYLNSHFQFVWWMLLFKSFKDAAQSVVDDPHKNVRHFAIFSS